MGLVAQASTMTKVMRTKPANPLWKRLQRRWRVKRGFEDAKTHQVDWVWSEGARYKRVRFDHPEKAHEVAVALRALKQTGCFPALIRHQDAEVWVAYVQKDFWVVGFDQHMARFFTTLYNTQLAQPTNVLPGAVVLTTLIGHLRILTHQALIDNETAQKIDQYAHQIAPPIVVQGFDYVDAVKKNFIVSQGRAIGIDIEALLPEQCLGMGLAKAEYRGLINPETLRAQGLHDDRFVAQYPLVRLLFLLSYFDQKMAQGKPGHIRLSALKDLL